MKTSYIYNGVRKYCECVLDRRIKNYTPYVEIFERVYEFAINDFAKKYDIPLHVLDYMEEHYHKYRYMFPLLPVEERVWLRENIDFENDLAKKELWDYNLNGRQYEDEQTEIILIIIEAMFIKYVNDSREVHRLLKELYPDETINLEIYNLTHRAHF